MNSQPDNSPSRVHVDSPKACLHYFLFVNTKSGNKQGLKYLQLGLKKLTYIFGNQYSVTVQIFDLFDQDRIKLCYKAIKQLTESSVTVTGSVRIIICGGDGTIPWVLNSAREAQINFAHIVIGILPIGTGNDFSRSIGWGYKTTQFSAMNFSSLHQLVKKWNKAQIGCYDIWDIEIETFEGGSFYEIKNQTQIKINQDSLKRSFTNYFGIGLDARVVYSVEKSRGSNAFLNKLLYTFVGIRNFFKPMQNIEDVIENFKQFRKQTQKQIQSTDKIQGNMLDAALLAKQGPDQQAQTTFNLKNGSKGLVCLNCTSYMCGLRNVWMTNKASNERFKNKQRQYFDDGKLEFIAFNNQLSLALERIMRTGVRVAQGSGPFEIEFKQKSNSQSTFMQIDGESVRIQKIKRIKVNRSANFPKGSIKVLINKQL